VLTKVDVRNDQGDLLSLELEDISDGLVLKDVEGLDPVEATIVTSSFANQNGTQYHSSRREDRQLVLKLGLEPDYVTTSVQDLRDRLYEFFMTQSSVKLTFSRDDLELDISGWVKSCKTPLFSRDPAMDVIIICPDGDIVDPTPVVFEGETTAESTTTTLTYPGTVETGVTFVLNVDRTLTEFTIYHTRPDGQLRTTEVALSMVAGDILTIVSVPGIKSAKLNHLGTETSVLYAVSPQSAWMELKRGDNEIRVYAEGDEIPYTITYNTRYGGL
jgi:hypothetical protein